MCGRYALSLPAGAVRMHVENELQRPVAAWEDEDDYNNDRGYNIAPRTRNVVVLRGGASDGPEQEQEHDNEDGAATNSDSNGDDTVVRMELMQWGLIPHWMKRTPDTGSMLKTINAREDTICEGGSMWKSIRGRKRCIVVAEGFYEWLHKGSERIPHFIKRKDGKLLCLAGLWDSVTYEGEKKPLHTYTIVTTDCNKQMSFLHNRMPAILSNPEDIAAWLDTSTGQWSPKLATLLKPFEGELEIYPVPREVGKVGTQSADYLKPVSERKGNIASFFAKQAQKKEDKKESMPISQGSIRRPKESTSLDEKQTEAFAADVKAEKSAISTDDHADKDGATLVNSKSSLSKAKSLPYHGDAEELPLNPDEGDAIATAVESGSHSKPSTKNSLSEQAPSGDKPTEERAIVLDQTASEAGESKQAAIVLSDLGSDSDSGKKGSAAQNRKPKGRHTETKGSDGATSKRKRPSDDKAAANATSTSMEGRPNTRSKRSKASVTPPRETRSKRAKHTTDDNAKTDNQGNKKLENFFEIQDA